MRISIVCVGKIKEKYLKLGIDEFSKRLSKYCKLEVIELDRSEEHTSELQSQFRISYAVFCLKKKNHTFYVFFSSSYLALFFLLFFFF